GTVVDARQQRDVLLELQQPAQTFEAARAQSQRTEFLLSGIDAYTTLTKHELVTKEFADARLKFSERHDEYEIARQRRDDAANDHQLANQQLLEAGGGVLQTLETRIAAQQEQVETV